MHDVMPRPTAVRFGLAAALILSALYWVGVLWSPVTSVIPAIVFLYAFLGLRRGNRWCGYGSAAFLISITLAMVAGELRVEGPSALPAGMVVLAILGGLFALLLFRAGRALPAQPVGASRTAWLTLSAAALLFLFTFKAFILPTASMQNTMFLGDSFFVRIAGPLTPARGDIVAFHYPPDPKQMFIKRVVAIGGDRVRFHDKTLILNGIPQPEPFAMHGTDYVDSFRDNFPTAEGRDFPSPQWISELPSHVVDGDLLVPAGKYFVLGDNRDDSLDSRYWGFVDKSAIIGKPAFCYFSANVPESSASTPQQLSTPILFVPGRIRWNRVFTLIR